MQEQRDVSVTEITDDDEIIIVSSPRPRNTTSPITHSGSASPAHTEADPQIDAQQDLDLQMALTMQHEDDWADNIADWSVPAAPSAVALDAATDENVAPDAHEVPARVARCT